MKSKQLMLLPITLLGLMSCMPDSYPKNLTYSNAIAYINKNSKGPNTPKEGYVEYKCDKPGDVGVQGILSKLGVKDTSVKEGKNQIDSSKIEGYINESATPAPASDQPLMYLVESNFKTFVGEGKNPYFSYSLTYVKEFVVYNKTADENYYYTRYYNTELRLTRYELYSGVEGNTLEVTQTYIY